MRHLLPKPFGAGGEKRPADGARLEGLGTGRLDEIRYEPEAVLAVEESLTLAELMNRALSPILDQAMDFDGSP